MDIYACPFWFRSRGGRMVVEESSASKEEESGQTNYNYVESFRER